ncbi:SPFH domain-containing protein [Streptomyces sp. NPDC014623]|uniref:SPFH domain-containing protein n=1 Tax=Streptomyces sp. NPDC014623 TaxID=3364875 RepID=UPI0036FE5AF2
MRFIEDVRGEWDELGERGARTVLPGPGAGDTPKERPAEVPAVTETGGAGMPEPAGGAEPAPAGAAAEDAPAAVDAPPAVEDEDIPADLGPALDAVAGVGRTAPAGGGVVDLHPHLDLDSDTALDVAEPDANTGTGPDAGPDADADAGTEPEPVRAPEPPAPGLDPTPGPLTLPEAVAGIGAEAGPARPAPAGQGGGAPAPRKPVSGGALSSDDRELASVALAVGAADPATWHGSGHRQPGLPSGTTAPVHLSHRDDERGGRLTGTGGAGRGAAQRPGGRRPPSPRSPWRQGPTRPAPLADPRLTERPGPVLPGWAALLTAAAGTAGALAVLWWQGALPAAVTGRLGLGEGRHHGIGTEGWALLALSAAVALFALHGLGRGRAGHASVLTLFGDYRGSVRRTGLLWISPLLRRRRVDVRLRHWRSEPLPAVDASGTALRAVVLVVWRVTDTARATLGVADHERYLRDQVEAALARVLSQLPADAFHEETRTLRDAEAVGDALTRMVKADCVPVGIEVYSAQPTGIEYAPEVAAAMQRCRVAAIDAKHRDGVLTSVIDAVDDTVGRLTARGIVELDDYEHKSLVRDLTVAFYTGRSGGERV